MIMENEKLENKEEINELEETELLEEVEKKNIPWGFIIFAGIAVIAITVTIILLFHFGGPLTKDELDAITSTASK